MLHRCSTLISLILLVIGHCAPAVRGEDAWALLGRLPEGVRFAAAIEDGATLQERESGRALARMLADTGLLAQTGEAWAALAFSLGLDPLTAYNELLGTRAAIGIGRPISREGFDDPSERWIVLSRVSETTESLFRRRLDAQPRDRIGGLPVLAMEDGRYKLAVARDGAAEPLLILAPAGAEDLFVSALIAAMGERAGGTGGREVLRTLADADFWPQASDMREAVDGPAIAGLYRSADGAGWLALRALPTRTGWSVEGAMPRACVGATLAGEHDAGARVVQVGDPVLLRMITAPGCRLSVLVEAGLGLEPGALFSGTLLDSSLASRSPDGRSPASVLSIERAGEGDVAVTAAMLAGDDADFDAACLAVRSSLTSAGVPFDAVEEAVAGVPGAVRVQPLEGGQAGWVTRGVPGEGGFAAMVYGPAYGGPGWQPDDAIDRAERTMRALRVGAPETDGALILGAARPAAVLELLAGSGTDATELGPWRAVRWLERLGWTMRVDGARPGLVGVEIRLDVASSAPAAVGGGAADSP